MYHFNYTYYHLANIKYNSFVNAASERRKCEDHRFASRVASVQKII